MPDHFCIVSDHAKLKLVLTDIMSVQQQIVIICPVQYTYNIMYVQMYVRTCVVCTMHQVCTYVYMLLLMCVPRFDTVRSAT